MRFLVAILASYVSVGSAYAGGPITIPQDTTVLTLPSPRIDTIDLEVHAAFSVHAIVLKSSIGTFLLSFRLPDSLRRFTYFDPHSGPNCTNGTGWTPTSGFCFQDSLVPGATSDTAFLSVQFTDTGSYLVDLEAAYTKPLQEQRYMLRIRYSLPTALVSDLPNGEKEFSISPNPANRVVSISQLSSKTSVVEIYDILGNLMLRQVATGEIKWSPPEAEGNYIVRVTERRNDGTMASRSKRLVFVR